VSSHLICHRLILSFSDADTRRGHHRSPIGFLSSILFIGEYSLDCGTLRWYRRSQWTGERRSLQNWVLGLFGLFWVLGFDGLNQSDPRWNDVNVISSLMKSFFRKLPDPLVTSELYGALIEASKTELEQVRIKSIKRLVDELPEPHYSTLRYLVRHLSRVAGKSHINKMDARNLVIVFGSTLIRPGDDSSVTMVTDMSHQCRIVETLIDKVDFFFPPDQDQVDNTVQQPNSPTQASNSKVSSISTDDRKDSVAKEIVSSIITAARKKRQTSLDSRELDSD
jgi:hypothetical protein